MKSEEKEVWMERGQRMVSEAATKAVEELNQEIALEGFRMKVYVSCGFSFYPILPKEVDCEFLERCGIKRDLEVKEK